MPAIVVLVSGEYLYQYIGKWGIFVPVLVSGDYLY